MAHRQEIYFKPWIGKNYAASRLLLMGESHYEMRKNVSPELTREVVKNHINDKEMMTPFFRKINALLFENGLYRSFADVAFANGIQKCFTNSRQQPNIKDIQGVGVSFRAYLSVLKPQKALILSKRFWERWLPEDNWEYIKTVKTKNQQSQIWKYKYDKGECLCLGIHHPSSWGFSAYTWRPIVQEFLKYSY